VSAASGTCHTVTATHRYRGGIGTGYIVHCFGLYYRSSSVAQTTVSTASGICHTITATCLYRGGLGTDLSVLCTLKPVPNLPR
jgi:hypothetical protein